MAKSLKKGSRDDAEKALDIIRETAVYGENVSYFVVDQAAFETDAASVGGAFEGGGSCFGAVSCPAATASRLPSCCGCCLTGRSKRLDNLIEERKEQIASVAGHEGKS